MKVQWDYLETVTSRWKFLTSLEMTILDVILELDDACLRIVENNSQN